MGESGLQPVNPDKRTTPIVKAGRHAEGRVTTGSGHVRRAGSRRQARIALFVVLVVGGVLVGGYFLFIPHDDAYTITNYTTATVAVETLQDTVELSGVVNARSEATVTAPESGTMGSLLVDEGDWVQEGQLIAILETEDLEDELASLQLQLQAGQRDYDRFLLEDEYNVRSFDRQRENLVKALADAEDSLTETRELFDLGSASRSEVEDAEDMVDTARDNLDDHDADVEESLAIHDLQVSNYEDDLQTIRDDIKDLEERIADARITSPMDGRIISIADAATTTGERIQQYETLMNIADSRNPVIESEIEEQYVSLISDGQPVAVDISDTQVVGAIERIGLTAESASDGGTPTVEIDIAIDAGNSEITIGTSAIVEVLVGEVPDAVVIPRGPYLTSGNRRYLYRVDGETATRTEVTYGTVTADSVQILSGVEPGDIIITSSYSNFIDYETVHIGGTK